VSDIFADKRYQRPHDEQRVRKIADNFDPDLLGVIMRADGTYAVMDGGHRIAAVTYLGWGDQLVPAQVFDGLTVQEEAHVFAQFNRERVRPDPLTLFRAQVLAGDERSKALDRAIRKSGIHLVNRPNHFRSIGIAITVAEAEGVDVVQKTLTVMQDAWGDNVADNPMHAKIFQGLALVIANSPKIDLKHLTKRVREYSTSSIQYKAEALSGAGREFRGVHGVAKVIANLYNVRLRATNRLPETVWRSWPRKLRPSNIRNMATTRYGK
jgi:hypothetical protein